MVGKLAKLAEGGKRRGRPRKKRKGRPPGASSGRQQQPPPLAAVPASRRSLRKRRPRRAEDYARYDDEDEEGYYFDELLAAAAEEADEEEDEEEDEDAEWERRGKKFKLLQKLPNYKHRRSPSCGGSAGAALPSSSDDGSIGPKPLRKRKPRDHGGECDDDGRGDGGGRERDGSGGGDREGEDERRHAAPACSGTASERIDHHCPISTPLPDKKMLEKVLDKLQKKDTYGVFAEPVDPEELPDYHEIIEHPMDFCTIRKKLSTGIYSNLQEFESDVFLVCTNAMEYNAPDTIYFRQARSIQELARKKFQIIRSEREDAVKSEQNIQSSSVTKKPIQSSFNKVGEDPAETGCHKSPPAMLASSGNACTGLDAVQAVPSEQPVIFEGCIDGSFSENKSEKGEESSAKNSPVKIGKKPMTFDEDHRTTYNALNEQPEIQSDSLFAAFENEPKHLVAVGLDAEYSYARSLARFAGALGPIAWRIASEKIEKALPMGLKFGPGWVGEYEPLPTPVLSFESHLEQHSSHHGHFKQHAKKWKDRTMEVERKATKSVASESVQLYSRAPSDSSTMGAIAEKANHLKQQSVPSEPFKQIPHLFRFNEGSQHIISNATFLHHNSSVMASSKDYSKAGVGTNVSGKAILHNSSPMMGNGVDISAQKSEQFAGITASRLDLVTSGSMNNVQSGHSKQSEMVAQQVKNSSSCMDTRGMSNGKDVGTLFGNSRASPSLGIIPSNQMRPESNCFNHGEHVEAIDDPVEVMKVTSGRIPNKISSSESLVADNQKLVIPTVPLPRSNSSAAATAAARAWMSVGRSSEHKVTEASKLFKMEGSAALGNSTSESLACTSRIHEDGMKRPMPSMSQLPSKVAAEELQAHNKHLTSFPQLILTELSRFHGQTPWRGLVPHVQHKQRKDVCPPDLNISFHSPGSPVLQSGILVDSQQPDLALQL